MKRKLVKQAGQAMTLTLPIDWIRSNGLKAGDEIELVENEKDLILKSNHKIIGKKIKMNFETFTKRERFIHIHAAYAKGVDELEIIAENNYYPNLNQTIGFAVTKQKENSFTIKDLGGNSEQDLDEIFKRVFQMVLAYYETASNSILNDEKVDFDTINAKDQEINKFILYLERNIIRLSSPNPETGKIMFAYAFALEIISDDIIRFWRNNLKQNTKKTKEFKKAIELVSKSLEKTFAVYYYCREQDIKELITLKEALRKIINEASFKSQNEALSYTYLLKIAETNTDLTHLSLMRKL